MAIDATKHRSQSAALEIQDELQGMDWQSDEHAAVADAASLIAEIIIEQGNDAAIAAVNDYVPAHLHQNVVAELYEIIDRAESEPTAQHQAEHRTDANALEWEQERIRHTLEYVTEHVGYDAAAKLTDILDASRNLELRQIAGDPITFDEDTHAQYVECVANLPQAVAAKENMFAEGWTPEQRQEAVAHEVNRMAYRMNSEVESRIMYQMRDPKAQIQASEAAGLSEESVASVTQFANAMANNY